MSNTDQIYQTYTSRGTTAVVFKILGAISAVISGLALGFTFGVSLAGVFGGMTLFAIGEVISFLADIERNTRATAGRVDQPWRSLIDSAEEQRLIVNDIRRIVREEIDKGKEKP